MERNRKGRFSTTDSQFTHLNSNLSEPSSPLKIFPISRSLCVGLVFSKAIRPQSSPYQSVKAGPRRNVECLNRHDLARIPRLEKAEFMDTDAILSHATAELSMPRPDCAKALAHIVQDRDKILDLAETLKEAEPI